MERAQGNRFFVRLVAGAGLGVAMLLAFAVFSYAAGAGDGAVYNQYCAGCHGNEGQGTAYGPGIAGEDADEVYKVTRKGDDEMPAFDSSIISDEVLEDLASYIGDLSGNDNNDDHGSDDKSHENGDEEDNHEGGAADDQYGQNGDDEGDENDGHTGGGDASRGQYGDEEDNHGGGAADDQYGQNGDDEGDENDGHTGGGDASRGQYGDEEDGDDASQGQYSPDPKPGLSLDARKSNWKNLSAYREGVLTVVYEIENHSGSDANMIKIIGLSGTTSGVELETALPLQVGDIAIGEHDTFKLEYRVPMGTHNYKSLLHATAMTDDGNTHHYPVEISESD